MMFLRMDIVVVTILFVLICILLYKVLCRKGRPTSFYRPFDYITGQTEQEFHDEEEIVDQNKDDDQ